MYLCGGIVVNISNSYRMCCNPKYNYNNSQENQGQSANTTSAPNLKNNTVAFKGGGSPLIPLLIMEALSQSNYKPPKPAPKKNDEPRHVYAYEMDLRDLNKKLYFTDTVIDGNKVQISHKNFSGYTEQILKKTTEIPDEFFAGCKTPEDKEYLVKKWLVESKYDYNYENIPYELLKTADDLGFYSLANHHLQMDYDEKAREKGIVIGKCEKTDPVLNPYETHVSMDVDGEHFDINICADKKYDIIKAAAKYDEQDCITDNPLQKIFQNIKDSHQCNIYKDGNKDVVIPKLLKSLPDINNTVLMENGNADDDTTLYKATLLSRRLGKILDKDIKADDVKAINYIEKSAFPCTERTTAISYYDEENDKRYLLCEDGKKLIIKDKNDEITEQKVSMY